MSNSIYLIFLLNHKRIPNVSIKAFSPHKRRKILLITRRSREKYEVTFCFSKSLITSLPVFPSILPNRLSGTQTNFSPAHSGTASDPQHKKQHKKLPFYAEYPKQAQTYNGNRKPRAEYVNIKRLSTMIKKFQPLL